jgi:hypothetical protein
MKTANEMTRMFRGSRLALVAILIATVAAAASANAQYKPTGDDGITASPKLRQQLTERSSMPAPAVAAMPSMSCSKCRDAWVTLTDTTSKGAGARALVGQATTRVAKHLCDGCATDWSQAGSGKGTHTVAAHKCTGCGAENLACCAPKGSSTVATKGMEKFEVAPVK